MQSIKIIFKICRIFYDIGSSSLPAANTLKRIRKMLAVYYEIKYVPEPFHTCCSISSVCSF